MNIFDSLKRNLASLLDWMEHNSDAITSFAALAALLVAVVTAWVGIRTLRQSKRDSIDKSRPYVFVKLEPSIGGKHVWDLVIKNVGLTSAYELTLLNSQWPEYEDDVTRELKRLFATPRTLPPGTSIRTYWNLDPMKKDDGKNAGITDPTKVRVCYEGPEQVGWRNKTEKYGETFEVDHTSIGMIPVGSKGITIPEGEREPKVVKLQELLMAVNELRRNI